MLSFILASSAIVDILFCGFTKNITFIFLGLCAFFTFLAAQCETFRFRMFFGSAAVTTFVITFYKIYSANLSFGGYILDYKIMILRWAVLLIIFAFEMLFSRKEEVNA